MDEVQSSLLLYIATASRVSGIGGGNSIILNGCHAKSLELGKRVKAASRLTLPTYIDVTLFLWSLTLH